MQSAGARHSRQERGERERAKTDGSSFHRYPPLAPPFSAVAYLPRRPLVAIVGFGRSLKVDVTRCVTLGLGGSSTGVNNERDRSDAREEHAVARGRGVPACPDSRLHPLAAPLQRLGTAERAAFWRGRRGRAGGGGLSRADQHRRPQPGHADARICFAKHDRKQGRPKPGSEPIGHSRQDRGGSQAGGSRPHRELDL